jgi:3-methyl-2-oxobutanoate hydroxymethyltransferase
MYEAIMKIHDFKLRKQSQQKISMLTCYDYPSAQIVSETELDCVLVGDSVAMAVHGHKSTITATIEMMVMHTAAVARGIGKQFLISDLPFLCHKISLADTTLNVKQLLTAGAHAIKIEGGDADTCNTIKHLVTSGVPIVGHIGLTPQSVLQLGGYKVQGREQEQAAQIIRQAQQLEAAGCIAIVIECVPSLLAKQITDSIFIPTIGIGAGAETDGQVLVWHDMLGLQDSFKPRFLRQFAQTKPTIRAGIESYIQHVTNVTFPALEHAFE